MCGSLIEPCILLLLREGSTYGYALLQRLPDLGPARAADPGAVYRVLRRLEEEGLVESSWDTGGSGPARRLYRLTPRGAAALAAWVEMTRENIRFLQGFVDRYERDARGQREAHNPGGGDKGSGSHQVLRHAPGRGPR